MRHWIKQIAGAMAALLLVSAAGCGKTEGPLPSAGGGTEAMGRYMESVSSLPEGIGYTQGFWRAEDGTLELLANKTPDRALGTWYLFRSADQGKTWAEADEPWLKELSTATISGADRDAAGNRLLKITQFPQAMIDALDRGEQPTEEMAAEVTEKTLWIKPDGSVEELTWEPPVNPADAGVQSLGLASNGDLMIASYSELLQVDRSTGTLKNSYKLQGGGYRITNYLTYGTTLALNDGPNIALYDLTTGEASGSIPCEEQAEAEGRYTYAVEGDRSTDRALALDAKGESLFFCDDSGIYRRLVEGTVNERLVDGALTALNMPANQIEDLLVLDNGDLLVLLSGADGRELYRYTYDSTVPTVPSRELNVYSLYENKTIRQAMGIYQRSNPDVHVVYEVGMDGGAATVSDALRNLSTALLADKGPDLLVLDGLPLESYIEKGVLLDLSEQVSGFVSSGEWTENIAKSFQREDGKLYALPARFSVPMLLAKDAGKRTTLSGLADWLTQEYTAEPGRYKAPLGEISPSFLMRQFYPVCAPAWTAEDGSIKTDVFAAFLGDLKRIYDLNGNPETAAGIDQYGSLDSVFNLSFGALYWRHEQVAATVGNANSFYDIAPSEQAITEAESGELALLPGQTDGVYIPRGVLGISARSRQPELARSFLETVLSEPVQSIRFDDGFPVNTAAMAGFAKNPYPAFDDGMSFGTNTEDGEMLMLTVGWPDDAYVQGWADRFKTLGAPSMPDEVVQQMVIDESKDFFAGTKSLEDTVTAVTEKVGLYLAE